MVTPKVRLSATSLRIVILLLPVIRTYALMLTLSSACPCVLTLMQPIAFCTLRLLRLLRV